MSMSATSRVVVPLLSSYKHGLLRRRLFRTLLGGVRIRKVPWYIHLIQAGIWGLPLVLSIPFIIVDGLRLWNQYFLALIYALMLGIFVLVEGLVVAILRFRSHQSINSLENEFDDEQNSIEIHSCCGMEMVDFIFSPKKIHSIILHPFVSGIFSFTGFLLLLPSKMMELIPIGGVVIVSSIGWFTICNAHYSLSTRAPPATAVYRHTDPLELKFLNRPFHVLLLGIISMILKPLEDIPSVYLNLVYASLSLLPLGWVLGVLPPLDAFIPWVMEQILTRFLGGSPMATDLRLLVIFVASVVSVVIVVPLENTTSSMLLVAFGFLLSCDIFSNFKAMLYLISSKPRNRITRHIYSLCKKVQEKKLISYSGLGQIRPMSNSRSYLINFLLSISKGALLLGGSLTSIYYTSTVENAERRRMLLMTFSCLMIAVCLSVIVSDWMQKPFIWGIISNFFYPKYISTTQKYKLSRKKLQCLSMPRRIILSYISPLVALALVGLGLSDTSETISSPIWKRIAAARILRKVWQNTISTHHELTVVSILILAVPSDNDWNSLGLPTQILIVGLLLDIAKDLLQKISFVLTSLIAFTWKRKLRTYPALNILIIAGSIILSPLLLAVILISSIFSAPLLSVFTLPIFVTSFPRPQHFWPGLVDFGTTYLKSTEETIYYQQAELEIARALHSSLSSGNVSPQPGTQLLLRFDNRMALVALLEIGHGFCTFNIRGLELQETSCHTEEATRIDSIFETFHNPQSKGQITLNTNFLNTLQMADSVVIQTYSDAHNVLIGIIDQPSALHNFSRNFFKTLVWVFYGYFKDNIKPFPENANAPTNTTTEDAVESANIERVHRRSTLATDWTTHSKSIYTTYVDESMSWSSVSSLTEIPPLQRLNNTPAGSLVPELSPALILPLDIPLDRSSRSILGRASPSIELPPIDSKPSKLNSKASHLMSPDNSDEGASPLAWKQSPLNFLQIFRLMQQFPHEWCSYLNGGMIMDSGRFDLLSKMVVSCFSLFDVPAQASLNQNAITSLTNPADIHRRFSGNIPNLPHLVWIKDQHTIWKLALKSYRYAVKLMYDEGSLGRMESFDELATYLKEYDEKWCIVSETESEWTDAILANTPHLFSLGRDQKRNIYTAHVLSLQDEVVHVGTLNPAAIQGIWADLALELLYLTNDDDERYSIQAHSHLLRNLSIQAADPPLGYSVYSSGLVTIPPF